MNPFKKATKQISIFTTAGYPELNSLERQIRQFETTGIDFIEVGMPFSDPLADGPTIQHTSDIAIKNGMHLKQLFQQIHEIQTSLPIVLMGYLNPVLNFGIESFLQACKAANIASVILPDLSVEIYERLFRKEFEKYGINISFLITPATPSERIEHVSKLCENSFVYLVSQNSTTGSEHTIHSDSFAKIKQLCGETPVFVGFGIQSSKDIQEVWKHCDGAIIGSAYLKALGQNAEKKFLQELRC